METEIRREFQELVTDSSQAVVIESTKAGVPEEGMNIEALQSKYLIIDWEVFTKDSRIVKEMFEPDADDELWKSQKHIHDITWRLYDTCRVHHISIKDGIDIYMLVEMEYPLSRDLDLWHVITDGDFPPIQNNPETKKDEIVPFHKQNDDLKKKLAKNNEAKMVIYNALPRKEYERIFMCQTAKEIWDTLLITHQGNNQVKANKIDLLVQQYEQFMIPEEESIDNAFAKFNTIITSLKALDEGFSSKNCVRKFLRALHPKWRAKVTAIEESKNLTTLPLE
ncbi:hypothetical protein Tco_0671997 [Tanacetum coccineum]